MNRFKDNPIAKVIVFIVLQIAVVMFVLGSIVTVHNAYKGWYSASKKSVNNDIMHEVASRLAYQLNDELYFELEDSTWDWDSYNAFLSDGAGEYKGIGYEIVSPDEKENTELKERAGDLILMKEPSENAIGENEVIYEETFSHFYNETYDVFVKLVDPKTSWLDLEDLYPDDLAWEYNLQTTMYDMRIITAITAVVGFVVMLVCIVFMCKMAGTNRKENSVLNKLPLDVFFAVAVIGAALIVAALVESLNTAQMYYEVDLTVMLIFFGSMILSIISTGYLWLFIARAKQGHWWKSTAVYCILKWIKKSGGKIFGFVKKIVAKLPLVWKTLLTVMILIVVYFQLAQAMYWSGKAYFVWLILSVLVLFGACYVSLCMKRLAEGAKRLAEGNLESKIDDSGLFLDFADHAKNLNSIGEGMSAAVEERLKSERFKAELITNVSHDIKTPLTSIINYVDLLKKENIENDKAIEYIDVLDRQSSRLKKLTEDIVEASKASTGAIKIDLAPCKVGILMEQTVGEYKEKAESEDLHFVVKVPEEDVEIMADGRRLWRVFDNLLNNICKYTQPGTRVYMNLDTEGDKAVITYRNISKYELDITEQELMERFVRGDKSRNTEGSGLGLSIARNLVELQGGTFDINIDGDLFKVIITFDLIKLF